MYCLRKLNSFRITPEILKVFYKSTIVSVWRYCLVCWGGGGTVSKSEKLRIDSIVTKAERVISGCQPSVDSICLHILRGKLEMVWSDNSHDLHGQLRSQLIPRGSGRLGLPTPAQIVTLPLSYRKPSNCIIVMSIDNVKQLNWECLLHYQC